LIIAIADIAGFWEAGKIKGVGCATPDDEAWKKQTDIILCSTVEAAEENEFFYYCDFCGKRLIRCGDEKPYE
jgi:hypothetical protein